MRLLPPLVCAAALLLTGCAAAAPGASPAEPATRPGDIVAIPADGTEPGPELDVGGPRLAERCESGEIPYPVDAFARACGGADEHALENGGGGIAVAGEEFEPGTYWAVLACDGLSSVILTFDVPGMPEEVEVPCADGAEATRQEIATLESSAEGGHSERATEAGDYVLWLVREGYRG